MKFFLGGGGARRGYHEGHRTKVCVKQKLHWGICTHPQAYRREEQEGNRDAMARAKERCLNVNMEHASLAPLPCTPHANMDGRNSVPVFSMRLQVYVTSQRLNILEGNGRETGA
jgi:hypothetical protein